MDISSYVARPLSSPFSAPGHLSPADPQALLFAQTNSECGATSAMSSGAVNSSLPAGKSSSQVVYIAWVRVSQDANRNSERLSQMFMDEGLTVQVLEMDERFYDNLPQFDLIMLESFGQVDANTIEAVSVIRMGSRAPLVMLMSNYARTEMIGALQAGVDAVWTLGMPKEMLLARCRALLRRWLPS